MIAVAAVAPLARPRWASRPAILVAATLLALGLRIACARGGLWLDEAWSVLLAHEVGTPAGVLVGINHDNNHHLNSLWLLAVGMDAPPLVQRALSIVTGTAAVPVAALLARRNTAAMLVTAVLFAVSPLLVTLGSEARGYAPMLLALLCAMVPVDRALAGDPADERRASLAIATLIGLLAQLTMVFGIAALAGWAFTTYRRRVGTVAAIGQTTRLFAPAMVVGGATLGSLAWAAHNSPTGFHFGSYEAFSFLAWLRAIVEMVGYATGFPTLAVALPVAALGLLVIAPRLGVTRLSFHWLAMFAFPVGLALIGAANAGHPRYYLIAGVALLLLIGEAIGHAWDRGGRTQVIGAAALAAIIAGSLLADLDLARNRRGDPAAAIEALAARSPAGTSVFFDRETGEGVLRVAAAEQHYALVAQPGCGARFAFVDRFGGEVMPAVVHRCGVSYRPIIAARTTGLSGTHWTLYERQP